MKLLWRLSVLVIVALSSAGAQECLPDNERLDCYPDPGSTESGCIARGCTWCPAEVDGNNIPWCFLPRNYGYKIDGVVSTNEGFSARLRRVSTLSYYGGDFETLTFNVEYQSDYRLRIRITPDVDRFEVPLQMSPPTGGASNLQYEVVTSNDPVFSFKVIRKSTGAVLFDTAPLGGFTYADQFLQLAFKLPNKNLYGIGENEQRSFRHSFDKFPAYPLYARDQPPAGNGNMYGVHPRYTVLEDDGSAHGVLFLNSNAQQFVALPTPGLLYKTIGGIFDIYFFFGPTPEQVVQQYTEAIGRAPLPPYWTLGFQLSRYGYNSIEAMRAAVDRTAAAQIPQDVQHGDIDIMERQLDFTYSKDRFAGLPEYVKEMKSKGVKFITILDPCISIGEAAGSYRPYDLGNQMDVWIKKADGKSSVVGKVWPEDPVYFPDYSNNRTREWWVTLIKEFRDLLDFDALWIDMNEPANFVAGDINEGCTQSALNNPPYVAGIYGGSLADKTLCPDHRDSVSTQYNTHSLFGWFQSEPTYAGVQAAHPGKRAFVLSRSTFPGSGKYVSHWLGDNYSQWTNLHLSIIGLFAFNHFGIPFVGADICGFNGDSNAELCQRWQQLGAFYTFSRNHNGIGYKDQDPAAFGPEVAASTKKALELRYKFLPHLYTLFYFHHTQGNTVIRPLWHEFPTDSNTAGIDTQFLWGEGFMISPALDQGQTTVDAYFPDARWFSVNDGSEIPSSYRGKTASLPTPLDVIQLHVRGGYVFPQQDPALNTDLSRQNPITLLVAPDDNNEAEGHLFYDDGESLNVLENGAYYKAKYVYKNGQLDQIVENDGYPIMAQRVIREIQILGNSTVSVAKVNGRPVMAQRTAAGGVVLSNLGLQANLPFTIQLY